MASPAESTGFFEPKLARCSQYFGASANARANPLASKAGDAVIIQNPFHVGPPFFGESAIFYRASVNLASALAGAASAPGHSVGEPSVIDSVTWHR